MARRRKPHNPAASAIAAERRQIEDNAAMAAAQGGDVRRDKAGRVTSVYRANVFTRLRDARSITPNQYEAALVLMRLWAAWKGLEGRETSAEAVDGSSGSAELVTDRMIMAGRAVEGIFYRVGPLNARLLGRFMRSLVEQPGVPIEWRLIVQECCGCADRDKQPAYVVAALENLRLIVEAPRHKAPRRRAD